jgi:hypothetical protein
MKWDPELLYQKAKLYLERANEFDHETHEFPLWSSLALELLARSALTHVHPSLNADPQHPESMLYACGIEGTQQPKSLPLHAVLLRLEKVVPGFGKIHRELCDYLALLRNDELHSGDLPYENLSESKWLPRFYEVCRILATFLDRDLEDLLGPELATAATRLIDALLQETAKAVLGRIHTHEQAFIGKSVEERQELTKIADLRSRLLPAGFHSTVCPACGSRAIIRGELIKQMKPRYEDDVLLIDLEYLAENLKCAACELELNNLEEILHAGLEPRFVGQRVTELHELFEPDFYEEYMNM